jgi:hypothetical protein
LFEIKKLEFDDISNDFCDHKLVPVLAAYSKYESKEKATNHGET